MITALHLTPEDLLAGAAATFEIVVPAEVLHPGANGQATETAEDMTVQLRPLTIGAFQWIMKAARKDAALIPLLMIKEALVQPTLSLEEVKQLHLGLATLLIAHIREVSGLTQKKTDRRPSAASQELLGFHRTWRSRATSESVGRSAGSEGKNAKRSPVPALRTRGNPKAIPQNVL